MKRVLFLCTENSNRSQMAEAFARRHGGAEVAAWSAGSQPAGGVNPKAVAAMAERGVDLAGQRSKSTAELPAEPFDVVVTMGCGDECPWVAGRQREDWRLPDPRDLPAAGYAEARDEIERRVLDLLQRLRASVPA